jgi:hypothetical protein
MINFDIKADSPGMDFLGVISYSRLSVDSIAVKTSTVYHSRMEWTRVFRFFTDNDIRAKNTGASQRLFFI